MVAGLEYYLIIMVNFQIVLYRVTALTVGALPVKSDIIGVDVVYYGGGDDFGWFHRLVDVEQVVLNGIE